ncbi:hypothetical protein QQX98_002696 [Neonectria punicea]|uniref:Uncharacterized protein n=1 Tax=Neonectria punicea TaxID=979145 RepID=A0ABR1HID9_9HYPO
MCDFVEKKAYCIQCGSHIATEPVWELCPNALRSREGVVCEKAHKVRMVYVDSVGCWICNPPNQDKTKEGLKNDDIAKA